MRRKPSSNITLSKVVEIFPLAAISFVAVWGLVLMVLLVSEVFYLWLIVVSALGSLVISLLAAKYLIRRVTKVSDGEHKLNIIALIFVIIWVVVGFNFTARHVITDRDPATYTITSVWLAENDSIRIPFSETFDGVSDVKNTSQGFAFSLNQEDNLDTQGAHMLPVLFGAGGKLFGADFIYSMNVLMGGLALLVFYSFAKKLLKQKMALLMMVVLGLSLPMIYFSRDIYTEPLVIALVFGGFSLLPYIKEKTHWLIWCLVALLFSAPALVRADGYLMLMGLLAFLFLYGLNLRKKRPQHVIARILAVALVATFVYAIAWLDISSFSGFYYRDVKPTVLMQWYLLIAATVFISMTILIEPIRSYLKTAVERVKKSSFPKIAAWTIAVAGLLSVLRPLWEVSVNVSKSRDITGYRVPDGEISRDLAEYTSHWVFWYLGPIIGVAAFMGLGLLVYKGIKLLEKKYILSFALLLLLTMLIYFYRPGITSDQIWASRRQLAFILPSLAVAAGLALEYGATYLSRRCKNHTKKIIALGLVLIIVSPLAISRPALLHADTRRLEAIHESCEVIGDDSAIVLVGLAAKELIMPLRLYCGAEVVGLSDSIKKDNIEKIVQGIRNRLEDGDKKMVIGLYEKESGMLPSLKTGEYTTVDASFSRIEQARRRAPLRTEIISEKLLWWHLGN